MRTLIVSDLHLGDRARRDVLRLAAARQRLLDSLAEVDRLVLLGDTVELMHRHPERAMATAEPVLREIGRALGPHAEAIVVPGNHDAPLIRGWALAQGAGLRSSHAVPPTASRALDHLVGWLAPARARVSYPGVWLGERMWGTHGHYLDHHLIPDAPIGFLRRPRRDPVASTPYEYEHLHQLSRRSRESLAARLAARPAATVVQGAADRVHVVPKLMRSTGLAPVTAKLVDTQMRRAAVPAMARVTTRLGIDADWVLFGHVHRRGPIGAEPWPEAGGRRLLNSGSWLYEPLLVDRTTPPHPYWPGAAVLLEDGRDPRTVGLLDDLDAKQLRAMFSVG
ncbi:MAG TPA: metallophosphoesterase [Solirubrobacteraceae bacterium]